LKGLKSLRRLILYNTQTTGTGAKDLEASVPGLSVGR
jgi:hypothetical protein